MNWDALGAIAELLGSLAVFATLVYLAIQVRHSKSLLERNEKIAMSQVHQARTDTIVNIEIAASQSAEASVLHAKPELINDPETDPAFRRQYRAWSLAHMYHLDNVLYQHELGLLESDAYFTANRAIAKQWDVWLALRLPITSRLESSYKSNKERA